MIPNIFSLLGESIVGKHIAKGIIFSNSPKKFHPNGSRIQVKDIGFHDCIFWRVARSMCPDFFFSVSADFSSKGDFIQKKYIFKRDVVGIIIAYPIFG